MTAFDLTGKVAWVTGAGKGLGRAIAEALAGAGATLAVTSRTREDLDKLAADLGSAMVLPGSVSEPAFADSCAEAIAERFGRLDVVVTAAGISPSFRRSEDSADADWAKVLDVNLSGTYYCARAAGRRMLEQGSGSIITVSSVHARTGFDRIAAYAASKGGVEALSRVLAVEWAPRGVRVNVLAPGYFHTDLSEGLVTSKWGERILAHIPQNRVASPPELGGAAVYLASDAAAYTTGSTVTVDGGWTA
ncbi:SDR family oxidoreductase [Amycolatopsis rubida]|uniref:SDR family oxidoreductase n=1 Tax=Amycolatopsis rubida TaxID=112413 RepID=A0ABX0C265_9PSEU|nr:MULTISPECIES: glucose 1-dehydrogenase [Amycolatopsis]MYW96262.1 SDR family oxidoreductase [Amycolatopsis rubida]NEC61253.1 SDR family oxidoreductase [Amycolatopsis rubida]OAP24216.1 2-dehydro-3-deoxy-D-gluconate 5-dehydrogenase [Amycolatopsis sp. M39]